MPAVPTPRGSFRLIRRLPWQYSGLALNHWTLIPASSPAGGPSEGFPRRSITPVVAAINQSFVREIHTRNSGRSLCVVRCPPPLRRTAASRVHPGIYRPGTHTTTPPPFQKRPHSCLPFAPLLLSMSCCLSVIISILCRNREGAMKRGWRESPRPRWDPGGQSQAAWADAHIRAWRHCLQTNDTQCGALGATLIPLKKQ